MKKSYATLGLVLCGSVGVWFHFSTSSFKRNEGGSEQSLRYQGKSADVWFSELMITIAPPPGVVDVGAVGLVNRMGNQYGNTNNNPVTPMDAFNAMGTNAASFLLGKFLGVDYFPERLLTATAERIGADNVPFKNAELERGQAITGLI